MSGMDSSQALAYRLSPQQREAAQPGGLRTRATVLIAGDFDPERLSASVRRVLSRYEIFRSSFRRVQGLASVVQFIAAELPADAGRVTAGEPAGELPGDPAAWLVQRPGRAFQVDCGDGFHVEVCALATDRRIVVFEASPLCADLWTTASLARQIADDYLGIGLGTGTPAGPPGLEYVDYADWRNELLENATEPAAGPSRVFWARRRVRADAEPALALPVEAPPEGTLEAGVAVPVPADTVVLLAGALGGGAGPEAALLACWQMFLARYTGSREIEAEWLSTGRNRPELADLIGNAALWLPCRMRLEPGRSFARAALAVAAEVAESVRHEAGYSAEVHYAARPELGTVAVQIEAHRGWSPRQGPGTRISLLAAAGATRPYGLKLACTEQDGGWDLHLYFSPHRIAAGEVDRLSRAFAAFLADAAADPSRPVDALSLLSAAARTELARLGGGASSPAAESLLTSFERQAARVPERLAVVAGEQRLTYAQLSRRANRLARLLLERGAGPDKLVGIALGRTVDLVVALLAAWRAGAAYLPVPADGAAARVLSQLDPRRLAAIVTTSGAAGSLPAGAGRLVLLDGDREAIAERSAAPVDITPDPAMLAYVLLTSGSTGRPKPVGVHHGAIANYTHAILEELEAGRWDSAGGLGFAFVSSLQADLGNTSIFPALASGGCLHLFPEDELLSASAFGRRMQQERIDVLKIVPSHFASLLAAAGRAVMPRRFLVLGGEAISAELARHVAEIAGDCRVVNHYGPTETTVGAAMFKLPEAWSDSWRPPIGRALANVRLYVVDGWGEQSPPGVAGELWVGGAGVARGYLGQPETTAERFVPDGFSGGSGGRLYRTGDRVRWRGDGADGVLEYLGRLDGQVKVRGHRIELGEIESALRSLPGVREAVVVAREERPGETRLVGYVVGPEGGEEAWRRGLLARLPEAMVPSVLVRLERLPLTANGKVDRGSLPAPESAAAWEAPRTAAEEALAAIWSEVLGGGRVGRNDNFFTLGGDSILSIQVVARARQRGLRLTPRQMFDHPTVSALAAVALASEVSGEEAEELSSVALSPIQQWFMAQDWREREAFVQALWLEISPELSAAQIASGVRELVRRHEALRLRFWREGEQWRQGSVAVEENEVFVVEEEPGLGQAEVVRRAQGRLSLEHGPLMQVVWWQGNGEPRLLWMVHHLAVDAVSWRILVEDLERVVTGEDLGARTASWSRWAAGLAAAAQSELIEAGASYWLDLPAREPAPVPAGGWCFTGQVSASLEERETQALLRQVPGVYHTQINDALLSALVLSRGETWVLLEGHGREPVQELDVTRTVGWFTTHYPVRLSGGGEAGSTLRAVKEELRRVPLQGIGYGLLRYLGSRLDWRERLAALSRQVEVSFNYLGQLGALETSGAAVRLRLSERQQGDGGEAVAGRPAALGLTAWVQGGRLRMRWDYDGSRYEPWQVEHQARQYTAALRALVAHCGQGAGGHTPSDFPLARLSGEELSRLEASYPDLEDVYPLTPLQAGLMFHALHSPQSSVYCNQMVCTLEGELDGELLRSAWERLVARHAVLRTAFVWEGLRSPQQVVLRRVDLPWQQEDWRGFSEEEQRRRLERLATADRERGHALERAPLMRLALVRTGEHQYRFLWSNHHLVLDGWSRSLTVAELLALYAGAASEEPEPPFRAYVAWLQDQDRAAAEAFWRRRLAGAEPALVAERANPEGKDDHLKRRAFFATGLSRQLEAFARRRQVTLNTVMAGAWAIVLSGHCEGREEVVFGATVAGRPSALAGVERMVGLFINTLPVRVRVPSETRLADWLREIQSESAEARQYEYSPLTDVQRWSGLPAGRQLFDSLLVFENFPLLPPPVAADDLRNFVQVRDGEVFDHNNYPLTVTVRPGAAMEIEIDFVRSAVGEPLVLRLLAAIQAVAGRLAASGEGDLVATLQEELRSMARKEAEVSMQNRREQLLAKMKSAAPKPVSFGSPQEMVDVRPYAPEATLPLVVEPRLAGVDLFAWARNQREQLLAALHRSGALLFRGAGAPTPEKLQELAAIFTSDLIDENGEHPRDSVSGHVYTPVHFSPRHLLLWHNENSFNQSWPRLIWFCCVRPADRGGESILADSRQVFARLPAAVREPFVAKGVTYVRKYGEGVGRSWQEVFQTASRAEVEARCRAEGLDFRWLDEQRLLTSCRRPAVVAHPVTGEFSWFNQAQHWHPSCLAGEVRSSLDSAFEGGSFPRDCLYGDGTPIADSTMETICETYRQLEVVVPLRAGEVLMVDNVLAAHARAPYEGERRLLVALGETGSFADPLGTS
jgi:amino acid adenylation domain-containing protein/non-ribosomal peptide synthase protein (TIGR01720 family)